MKILVTDKTQNMELIVKKWFGKAGNGGAIEAEVINLENI